MARTVTIANGESLSGAVDLEGLALARLEMPATWTAADITFQVSHDGATYTPYYDETGDPITLVVAASRTVRLPPLDWDGVRYVKVQSGTPAAAVNQGGARTVTLHAVSRT